MMTLITPCLVLLLTANAAIAGSVGSQQTSDIASAISATRNGYRHPVERQIYVVEWRELSQNIRRKR